MTELISSEPPDIPLTIKYECESFNIQGEKIYIVLQIHKIFEFIVHVMDLIYYLIKKRNSIKSDSRNS